jgi:hypothetical protein
MARASILRVVAALAASAGLFLVGPAAMAAGPVTTVTHVHGLTETFVDVGPDCEGTGLYEITVTYNLVDKVSVFDDGRVHATFTQVGTFEAVSLVGDPGGSGHFTVWGGFNQNQSTVNGTFTFNLTGALDDGTRLSSHSVDHFNVRPDGVANEFTLCHD